MANVAPYCLLFSDEGTLLAKGIVNYADDLDSLFLAAAQRFGLPTTGDDDRAVS